MKKHSVDFLKGPLLANIIRYTIPIILTNILQLLFNTADMIVVGRYCGSISMAAISATSQLVKLVTSLFIGFSVGVGVAVAHGLGGNRHENVHRTVHTALPIVLIAGTAMTVIGLILSKLDFARDTGELALVVNAVFNDLFFRNDLYTVV